MGFGEGMQSAADALLGSLGTTVTFTAATQTYDPATGSLTTSSSGTYTVKATPPRSVSPRYDGADIMEEGGVNFSISAKELRFTPDVGNKVAIQGESFTVTEVERVFAQEVVVLFKVTARK